VHRAEAARYRQKRSEACCRRRAGEKFLNAEGGGRKSALQGGHWGTVCVEVTCRISHKVKDIRTHDLMEEHG